MDGILNYDSLLPILLDDSQKISKAQALRKATDRTNARGVSPDRERSPHCGGEMDFSYLL